MERRDWTGDQRGVLEAYALQHGLHLDLDVTDDGDTPFAGFCTHRHCYPNYTVVCAPDAFFVTDQAGYTISCAETLAQALKSLSTYLEIDQADALAS